MWTPWSYMPGSWRRRPSWLGAQASSCHPRLYACTSCCATCRSSNSEGRWSVPKRTIYLQSYYSGTWHNMTYTHTNVDGNYWLALPTTTVGVANYRAYMTKASTSRPASTTGTRTFTVLPWTTDLCGGYILATSHVKETAATATLVGTVTNETGFDVQMNSERPVVEAMDTNGDSVRLFGDFYTAPDSRTYNLSGVLHAGQSVSYR